MCEDKIERFYCNRCKGKTKHFIRGEYSKTDDDGGIWFEQWLLIIECCGCENLALVKKTLLSEDIHEEIDKRSGNTYIAEPWEEAIYPPVTYRNLPPWFNDLQDFILRNILNETYKALQTESNYLATFGSRTLIDRLIVLTVGDRGNFQSGLQALQDEGKLSPHEREILNPVVDAGNAAAHRGWEPTKEQLATILDTAEGLIHRLLVLPKMVEELEGAVPNRHDSTQWAQDNQ